MAARPRFELGLGGGAHHRPHSLPAPDLSIDPDKLLSTRMKVCPGEGPPPGEPWRPGRSNAHFAGFEFARFRILETYGCQDDNRFPRSANRARSNGTKRANRCDRRPPARKCEPTRAGLRPVARETRNGEGVSPRPAVLHRSWSLVVARAATRLQDLRVSPPRAASIPLLSCFQSSIPSQVEQPRISRIQRPAPAPRWAATDNRWSAATGLIPGRYLFAPG